MTTHARRAGLALVAFAAAASLAACASPSANTASADGAAATPVTGGTLTFLESQVPTCFYAGGGGFYPVATILNQVADKLTYQDPETREITPWLATDWEVNADATEYTFHLRDDVTYSTARRSTPRPSRSTSTTSASAIRGLVSRSRSSSRTTPRRRSSTSTP